MVKAGYRMLWGLQETSVEKVSFGLGNSLYGLWPLGSLENGLVLKNTWVQVRGPSPAGRVPGLWEWAE